jgi:tetratricopeptide (TPR) repeat protein
LSFPPDLLHTPDQDYSSLVKGGSSSLANSVLRKSTSASRLAKPSVGLGCAHQGLGDTSRLLRDYRTSKTHYEQALLLFTESDAREGMAWALHGLGDLAREQKAYPQAQEYHRQSLVLFEKIGDLNAMSETLNALGNTLCSLAEYAQARVYFQQALQVALSVQAIPVALDVVVGLVRILAEEGASQQALELLAISLHHSGSEQETLDKAASLWSKLTAKFTPGFVMAAQAHHGLPTLKKIAVEMGCSG